MAHKIIRAFSLLAIFSVTQISFSAPATRIVQFSESDGKSEFLAIGKPSALKVRGKGSAPYGTLTLAAGQVSGTLRVNLDSFDTGIKLRNRHMKEKYLQTQQFPQAKLEFKNLSLVSELRQEKAKAENLPFEAILTLHGVTKPVTGSAQIEKEGNELSIEAAFGIKISDFNIESPSFAGVTVADHVEIKIETEASIQ